MSKATIVKKILIICLNGHLWDRSPTRKRARLRGVSGLRKGRRCLFTSESLHAKPIDS